MSLGASAPSDGSDPLSQAVNSAVDSGIVAVVAAGNSGSDAGTVSTPAAAERAISVCAMRDVGELGWSLAPWSSRGPTVDGRIKPDICAPGYKITAPMAGTQSRYVAYSGTSMASPFVAGLAALLLQVNPYLGVDEVQELLYSTAQDWGPEGKDSDFGYGRVDAYQAIKRVLGRRTGTGPANPIHAVGMNSSTAGVDDWWVVDVADITKPLAATLLLTDSMFSDYDLDLYVFDAAGNPVASSFDIARQETANFRPLRPGAYYLLVTGYSGEGPYTLDVSWGIR
jgi:serine protease AprX